MPVVDAGPVVAETVLNSALNAGIGGRLRLFTVQRSRYKIVWRNPFVAECRAGNV
jgi:hypothetical protein